VSDHFDPNEANEREREAIKLARSMDDADLRRVMGTVMATWTPVQLRRHGAATFVLARRKEA
jgi:hypothetical protein